MKLDEYLIELENCPDEELDSRLQVKDNTDIFLRADFEKVVEFLNSCGRYSRTLVTDYHGKPKHDFESYPIGVALQVASWLPPLYCSYGPEGSPMREEGERQKRDYNMSISLHPSMKENEIADHYLRAIALVIKDIAEYIIKEKIPACLPRVVGQNPVEDVKDIVVYEPE